jgi:hypothetical protein
MLTVERAGGVYRDGWISVKTDRGSYCEQHNHPRYEKLRSLHRKAIQHTIFRLVEAWPTSEQRQLLAWWTLRRAQEQGVRRAAEPVTIEDARSIVAELARIRGSAVDGRF